MAGERCLVVENHGQVTLDLTNRLKIDGYDVDLVSSGEDAVDACRSREPEVVLLDAQLPGIDVHATAQRIRAFSDAAILILDDGDRVADRVAGLSTVVDDYVTSHAPEEEIVARVRAVCRRMAIGKRANVQVHKAGNVELDPQSRVVTVGGVPLQLTRLEFDLLAGLVAASPNPLSKNELIVCGWGGAGDATGHALKVHLHNVKRKLASTGVEGIEIQTVRGYGFRLLTELSAAV